MDDSENTTSFDDRSEAYSEVSARDCLAEGIIGLLLPTVEQIDERVKSTRCVSQLLIRHFRECPGISQLELRQHIDTLAEDLRALSEKQQIPYDLDSYVKKLVNAKRRVVLVNSILQNTQLQYLCPSSSTPSQAPFTIKVIVYCHFCLEVEVDMTRIPLDSGNVGQISGRCVDTGS
nr:SNAPIN protein homolog isoform X1 [Rhipicephalus microplus]